MRMNRRNALIGLGAVATGAGAVFGSGAFTSVEAERSANINVADDADAFLALEPGPGRDDGDGFIQVDGDGQIEFFFDGRATGGDQADPGDSGLLDNATTTFDELLTITNNGTNDVEITVDTLDSGGASVDIGLSVNASDSGNNDLTEDEPQKNFDFVFDLTDDGVDSSDADSVETIQINADPVD